MFALFYMYNPESKAMRELIIKSEDIISIVELPDSYSRQIGIDGCCSKLTYRASNHVMEVVIRGKPREQQCMRDK